MKTPNMMAWCDELATTTDPQATGGLVKDVTPIDSREIRLGYCCLGIGEKKVDPDSHRLDPQEGFGLPSRTFIDWLGITESAQPVASDPVVDWPRALLPYGETVAPACTTLNDGWLLTFKQIADVVRYFGLRTAEVV